MWQNFFVGLCFTLKLTFADQICMEDQKGNQMSFCPDDTCCSVDICNKTRSPFKCCEDSDIPNDPTCSVCPACSKIQTIYELFLRIYFILM